MKRVIITGAAGFVGSNIVTAFLDAGWRIYTVDRSEAKPAFAGLPNGRLQQIASDCSDLPPLNADLLIHAAAITATPEERGETPEANLRANLDPLLSVMEYTERQGIARSIFISSAAVFGNNPSLSIAESAPRYPRAVYGLAKSIMEDAVETMRANYGRDFVCVRLGAIYGPNEVVRSTRPKLSLVAQMIGAALNHCEIVVQQPRERRQWTYAPDIGRALIALADADVLDHGLYHLAGNERLSNLEVAQEIAKLVESLSVHIDQEEAPEPRLSSAGWLDNSRFRHDIGFGDWTPMSERTLGATLQSIRARLTNA